MRQPLDILIEVLEATGRWCWIGDDHIEHQIGKALESVADRLKEALGEEEE